jgi:hypothetical protein
MSSRSWGFRRLYASMRTMGKQKIMMTRKMWSRMLAGFVIVSQAMMTKKGAEIIKKALMITRYRVTRGLRNGWTSERGEGGA